jgi:hypothetical protein
VNKIPIVACPDKISISPSCDKSAVPKPLHPTAALSRRPHQDVTAFHKETELHGIVKYFRFSYIVPGLEFSFTKYKPMFKPDLLGKPKHDVTDVD